MSRLGRVGRRPDAWASPHERATSRAAECLDEALDPTEAAWLDEHLAGCPTCLATAEAYESDRLGLRALRDIAPQPPRDLWARTAAAIEQEAAGHGRAATGSVRRSPLAQWGAIAGIAVVAVVVGASVLQGGWLVTPAGTTGGVDGSAVAALTPPPAASDVAVIPGATPIAVDAGVVGWFDVGADGSYAYNTAKVDQVCAHLDQASCAALDNGTGQRVALSSSPKSIITSPSSSEAVVVGSDQSGGNQVFVVALPKSPQPSPTPTTTPTSTPTTTPTSTPTDSATPTPSSGSSATPPTTAPPSPSTAPSDTPTATPTVSAAPSATATALAIVSGVTVVGDSAAFSPDGHWFAFTARPADGSTGPDLYLWRVGDAQAHAVTTDHRSTFASWAGGLAIGSRPAPAPGDAASADPSATPPAVASPDASAAASPAAAVAPSTFTIDPATGAETPLDFKGWRPAVAPTGDRAVAWQGTVRVSDDGTAIVPTDGKLVLVRWGDQAGDAFIPVSPALSDGPIGDFTVRWDETGTWLAVWVADAADPSVGRLSLVHIDPKTGAVDRPEAGPQDVPALPGFSIENGRLAWATPPSQDGEGSRVQIVAWSAAGVGSIESAPGQEVVVVR